MISGERVRQARELCGLTQEQLASYLGVNQSTVAFVEGGHSVPTDEFVQALALRTGFPPSFFRQEPIDFPLGSLLFRSRVAMTARERARARRYAQTVYELAHKLAQRTKEIPLRLPRLTGADPSSAAAVARAALGLSPDTPIPHLIHVIERAGVLVLALPIALDKGDAFSAWVGPDAEKPVIVLSHGAPGDRLRWNVAHELAHLVIHQAINGRIPQVEREANQFAAEFLLPASAMRQEITTPVTLAGLAPLKRRWGVALQALIRRAHELGIVGDRRYRYLFEQLSKHGWRTKEPDSAALATERPRAVRKMAELLYGIPIDYKRLAADANLTKPFVQDALGPYADKSGMPPKRADRAEGESRVLSFPAGGGDGRARQGR